MSCQQACRPVPPRQDARARSLKQSSGAATAGDETTMAVGVATQIAGKAKLTLTVKNIDTMLPPWAPNHTPDDLFATA
jgi:hypothetical protein